MTTLNNSLAARTSILNTQAAGLLHIRRGLARVRAGTGFLRLLCIGDSKSLGVGSNGALTTNIVAKSYPAFLAKVLAASGIPAIQQSKFGTSLAFDADSRIQVDAAWVGGSATLGGATYRNSTTTSSFAVTPTVQIDSFRYFYIQASGYATHTVNVDGGSTGILTGTTTVNGAGATALMSNTITFAKGAHTINIQRNGTGTNLDIVGWEAWDSTTPSVCILQAGYAGSVASQNSGATTPFAPLNVIAALGVDGGLVELGTNDMTALTDIPSVYTPSIQAIASQFQASGGDAILMATDPIDTLLVSQDVQDSYTKALRAIASPPSSISMIDLRQRNVSYATYNALGMMYDQKHPNALGYADKAQAVARLLLAA